MNNIYEGRGISAGIGIGLASILPDVKIDYPEERIDQDQIDEEYDKFQSALERAQEATGRIRKRAGESFHEPLSNLFSVQEMILEDPLFIEGVRQKINNEQLCAEGAVIEALQGIRQEFSSRTENTPIQTRKMDIMDAGWRVLRYMDTSLFSPRLPQDGIIVASDITPSMAVRLEETSVEGLVVQNVDRSSHIAVITQALEIPAVGVLDNGFYQQVQPGNKIIVGANQNRVITQPDEQTIRSHRDARDKYFKFTADLREKTRDLDEDDLSLDIRANLGFLSEVSMARRHGALGAGLVRTEFLFMADSAEYPDKDTQTQVYKRLCEELAPYPMTLRTFDIGGDKKDFDSEVTFLSELESEGRGIYRSLRDMDQLKNQLKAMLEAHDEFGNIRILLPMVGSPNEISQVRSVLEELSDKHDYDIPPLGVIIEIPSLVYMLDEIAEEVDFMSVGTNDLMYYLIGADRFAWQTRDFVDLPDPALLRVMNTIASSLCERPVSVGVCGEIAGNPLFTPVWAGMGFDELSMSPIRIPEVKFVAKHCDSDRVEEFSRQALELTNREELRKWEDEELTEFVESLYERENLISKDQELQNFASGMV